MEVCDINRNLKELILVDLFPEHIPSPLPNTRNIVIKQPIGMVFCSLGVISSTLLVSRCCVSPREPPHLWLNNWWCQFDLDSLEFPVCHDHAQARRCSCSWVHRSYQTATRDTVLLPSPC